MLTTEDPEPRDLDGVPTTLPALTSLHYRVCGGDPEKFAEACRLVVLFVQRALDER
jgi:hypothetical protein